MIHSELNTSAVFLQLRHRIIRIPGLPSEDFTVYQTESSNNKPVESLLCSALSGCSKLLAVATDAKLVRIVDISTGCVVTSTVACPKRPVFLAFHPASNPTCLFIADKGGDVMRLDLLSSSSSTDQVPSPEPILGHLAMLTAIDIAGTNILATADADARIRLSRLPNAYNIEAFCLGHSGPVLDLCTSLISDGCLLSLSADCSLRAWRLSDGVELSRLQLPESDHDDLRLVPCHLVVSPRLRLVACVSIATTATTTETPPDDADKEFGPSSPRSRLTFCRVGPPPECQLGFLDNNDFTTAATTVDLSNGRVAACCYDAATDSAVLLGDNPAEPLAVVQFGSVEGGVENAKNPPSNHPALAWQRLPSNETTRLEAAQAASERLKFSFDDVLAYASLEAGSGLQEYLDGKAERIQRLRLKRKRPSALLSTAGAGSGIGSPPVGREEESATVEPSS